jgi:sporulation protein YlmC with PRC-barrel domain
MLEEITQLNGLPVYTPKGIYLGTVYDTILDTDAANVYELYLGQTNEDLVEESRDLAVPFRWVQSITDIIVLRYFPGKIKLKARPEYIAPSRPARKRKLRVKREDYGDHGVSRKPWR